MTNIALQPGPGYVRRIVDFPLSRILIAAFFVAVPFALVATLLAPCALAIASSAEPGRVSLCATTIGILWALGVYQITGSNGWPVMLATLPGFILAGCIEEVAIRGILFRVLEQRLGSWIALGISAALFGLAHLLNPAASMLNATAISIEAGVLLAAAYMLTRRLWLCIGIHIGWNFTQGGVFSSAFSGGQAKGLLNARLVGPDWLSGGAFGAEASVVALAICGIAGILLLLVAARSGHAIQPFWVRSPKREE
jgi:hypothetical protein